jgi:hypothetical protein
MAEAVKQDPGPSLDHLKEAAEEALKMPEDFGYSGDLPLFETWGFVASRNRDSEHLDNSNYDATVARLEKISKDDMEGVHSSHWLVGWCDQIAVKIYNEDGSFTEIFKEAVRIADELQSYPVLDEEDLSRRQYEDDLENIETNARFSTTGLPEDWKEEVFSVLWDGYYSNGEFEDDHGTHWPSEEAVLEAAHELWPDLVPMDEEEKEGE